MNSLFSLLDPWGDFLILVYYDSLQGTQLLSRGKLQKFPNKEKRQKFHLVVKVHDLEGEIMI